MSFLEDESLVKKWCDKGGRAGYATRLFFYFEDQSVCCHFHGGDFIIFIIIGTSKALG